MFVVRLVRTSAEKGESTQRTIDYVYYIYYITMAIKIYLYYFVWKLLYRLL